MILSTHDDEVLSHHYIFFIFPRGIVLPKNHTLIIPGPQETMVKLCKTPPSKVSRLLHLSHVSNILSSSGNQHLFFWAIMGPELPAQSPFCGLVIRAETEGG